LEVLERHLYDICPGLVDGVFSYQFGFSHL